MEPVTLPARRRYSPSTPVCAPSALVPVHHTVYAADFASMPVEEPQQEETGLSHDAYDEYNTDSIEIGLGSSSSQILKKRQKEISMSIEDRLRMEKDKTSNFVGATKRMHVKGEGATKEGVMEIDRHH